FETRWRPRSEQKWIEAKYRRKGQGLFHDETRFDFRNIATRLACCLFSSRAGTGQPANAARFEHVAEFARPGAFRFSGGKPDPCGSPSCATQGSARDGSGAAG